MSDKRVYFAALVQRQKESNISIEAFCRDNNIGSGSFHYWKQKLTSEFSNSKSAKRIKPTESRNKGIELVPLTIESNAENRTCNANYTGNAEDRTGYISNREIKEYSPEVIYPNGVSLKLGQSLSKEELISFVTLLD